MCDLLGIFPQNTMHTATGLKMYLSSGAAVTKCHKQGSLEQEDLIISRSGGQKSTVKVAAGLVPPEGVRKSLVQSPPSQILAAWGVPWVVDGCLHVYLTFSLYLHLVHPLYV